MVNSKISNNSASHPVTQKLVFKGVPNVIINVSVCEEGNALGLQMLQFFDKAVLVEVVMHDPQTNMPSADLWVETSGYDGNLYGLRDFIANDYHTQPYRMLLGRMHHLINSDRVMINAPLNQTRERYMNTDLLIQKAHHESSKKLRLRLYEKALNGLRSAGFR